MKRILLIAAGIYVAGAAYMFMRTTWSKDTTFTDRLLLSLKLWPSTVFGR